MAIDTNGADLIHHDITKYSNKLNNLTACAFSPAEIDIFWAVVTQLSGTNKNEVTFTYKEIATEIGYKGHSNNLTKQIEKMAIDLLTLNILEERPKSNGKLSFIAFNPFRKFKGNGESKQLTVQVEPEFMPYINELGKTYTRFLFKQLTSLKLKYAKNLFRLLKQFHSTGYAYYDRKKLCQLLGTPKSYYSKTAYIENRVLIPAIKELNSRNYFSNLKFSKKRKNEKYKNSPVIGFKFTFTPQLNSSDLQTIDNNTNYKASLEKQKQKLQYKIIDASAKNDITSLLIYVDELKKLLNTENVKIMDSKGNSIPVESKHKSKIKQHKKHVESKDNGKSNNQNKQEPVQKTSVSSTDQLPQMTPEEIKKIFANFPKNI